VFWLNLGVLGVLLFIASFYLGVLAEN